ncbi:MAG: hypothetical protein NTNFB01_24090 [Nitrospira sp.]
MLERLGERTLKLILKSVTTGKEKCLVMKEIKKLGGVKVTPENVLIVQFWTDSGFAWNVDYDGIHVFHLLNENTAKKGFLLPLRLGFGGIRIDLR